MNAVIMHNVVSLDGFIADEHDDTGPLFDWYFGGDIPPTDESGFRMTKTSADYVRGVWNSVGAMVIGRRLFDLMNGWEGRPPVGEHVIVVSHRPKPLAWHPEASYPFVDNIAEAVALARELAGPTRMVAVAAGDVGGQALAAGLVDEVAMDLVPVIFGSGRRYFGSIEGQHLLDDAHIVVRGSRVLHLRYRVRPV